MKRYTIGIDIGTTGIKMLLLDDEHTISYEASQAHPFYTEHPGWAEEDAALWWENTCALLQETMQHIRQLHGRRSDEYEISAIGVSGMVPAIVLLDEAGCPLRRSIQQNDARCVEQIARLGAEIDQPELFHLTGGYTNQQHVLPRMLWVQQHEPEIWSKIQKVFGSYDWIVHQLTGQWSIEENWAVESGLYDIHKRSWISNYFHDYGLSMDWFPTIHEPMDIVGHVKSEVASATGVPEGTPVIAGSADHVSSAFSAGVIDDGDLLIKFGGAGDILFCTDRLTTHEKLFFDVHDIPGKYLLNGCMASSGSLVRWYVEQFVPGPPAGINVYQYLDSQAEHIGPGSDGIVVLPYLLGEKTPIFDPHARGVFFGLSLHHTPAHLFRAILESVIYGFRHHIDVLAEKGLRPKRVFATNGGAKSKLWLQIASDIIGLPLTSYKGHPGSSLGVAFLAGKSVGLYKDWRDVLKCLPEEQHYTPSPDAHQVYNVSYGIYRRLYGLLKEDFHLIATTFSG